MTDAHINYSIPITALVSLVAIIGGTAISQMEFVPLTPRERGAAIYRNLCVTCHHADPAQERGTSGTEGPAVAGSSLELLTKRVREVAYPEGYTPKRDTKQMTTFALSDEDLAALHLFLNPDLAPPATDQEPDKDPDKRPR